MREASEKSVACSRLDRKAIQSPVFSQRTPGRKMWGRRSCSQRSLQRLEDSLERKPAFGKEAVSADLFGQRFRFSCSAAVKPSQHRALRLACAIDQNT